MKNTTKTKEQLLKELEKLNAIITKLEKSETERKQAEEELKAYNQQLMASEQQLKASNQQLMASEQQLKASNQQLLEQTQELSRMATVVIDSNDAITIQDLEGNITAWNSGASKVYGYSEQEALKMNVSDLVPEEKKAEALNLIVQLQKGELVESLETKRQTKDGKILDIWMVVTKLVDKDGKLIGVATTERDIFEPKQAEVELIKHRDHLEELVKERTKELEEKNKELDKTLKVFVGRELTIRDLQNRIRALGGK